jgi:hypothetical protein
VVSGLRSEQNHRTMEESALQRGLPDGKQPS